MINQHVHNNRGNSEGLFLCSLKTPNFRLTAKIRENREWLVRSLEHTSMEIWERYNFALLIFTWFDKRVPVVNCVTRSATLIKEPLSLVTSSTTKIVIM